MIKFSILPVCATLTQGDDVLTTFPCVFLQPLGVLSHLSLLEVQARNNRKQKQDRVTELKAKAAELMEKREQLKAEVLLLQVWFDL